MEGQLPPVRHGETVEVFSPSVGARVNARVVSLGDDLIMVRHGVGDGKRMEVVPWPGQTPKDPPVPAGSGAAGSGEASSGAERPAWLGDRPPPPVPAPAPTTQRPNWVGSRVPPQPPGTPVRTSSTDQSPSDDSPPGLSPVMTLPPPPAPPGSERAARNKFEAYQDIELLRGLCRKLSLNSSGSKEDLIKRLMETEKPGTGWTWDSAAGGSRRSKRRKSKRRKSKRRKSKRRKSKRRKSERRKSKRRKSKRRKSKRRKSKQKSRKKN